MAQVILFGGGDGGGLIIGPNGVRPIPPFDPALRLQLHGLSSLLAGSRAMPQRSQGEMGKLVNKVSNLIIEQVEGVVGKVDGDAGFVYQDEDGGFTCGSTGKPPIPFPWPPLRTPSLSDLITNGVLERELVDFVSAATSKKIKLTDLLEDPGEAAEKVGMKLSDRTIDDLKQLAPSRLNKIADPVNREVVQFFHKVAEDGRFVSTWATRPAEASAALKVQLSDRAFERIVAGGSSLGFDPGTVMNPAVVIGVIIGVVIMLVPTEAGMGRLDVRDLSGFKKF